MINYETQIAKLKADNERLTEKSRISCDDKYYTDYINYEQMVKTLDNLTQKLGQLEDIEEELGINLITLFKALKNGIWSKEHLNFPNKYCRQIKPFSDIEVCFKNTYDKRVRLYFNHRTIDGVSVICDSLYIDDYGITWAVAREELE